MEPHLFTITMPVQIRACVLADLAGLEWLGMFSRDREIIRATFEAQSKGEAAMLVADAMGYPVGQVWLDLVRSAGHSTAYLWALRVIPWMQRLGIGVHLIEAAERLLSARGFARVELSVDHDNLVGCQFYEVLGFHCVGDRFEPCDSALPGSAAGPEVHERKIYVKELHPSRLEEARR